MTCLKLSFLLILTLLLFSLPSTALASNHTDVTVSEAKTMIASNPALAVLDVRNQSEYDSGHIRNAKLIPHTELEERLDDVNKDDEILVYCRSGIRSRTASELLANNGFLHVYNMLGGITAWIDEKYPVYVKYTSIQKAINNANEGDTIFVSSELYHEHLTVNKSLTLVGENKDTTIIDGNNTGTVFHVKTDSISISGFTIRKSGCACEGYSGVCIESHQNVNVTNNLITQNGFAIRLDLAHNVTVARNYMTNNPYSIVIFNSSSNFVLGNTITNNTGVELYDSSNNCISGNTITNNNLYGIRLLHFSSNNTITGNTITNNHPYGAYLFRSSNNKFYHNNLIGNTQNVHTEPSGYANFWHYGIEGNYWSNYTGVDLDHDGIGDNPHEIDADNTDNYPLIGIFSSFNTSPGCPVNVISNSTIIDLHYFESNRTIKMHVSNMTTGQTHGFCRVRIPYALMNETYHVTINGTEPHYWNYTLHDDGDNRWIYFSYEHSTLEIIILPEFPSLTILSLFMIATLLAVTIHTRKHLCNCTPTSIFRHLFYYVYVFEGSMLDREDN